MFEEKTFESILGAMLGYVNSRYPDLDTREGAMITTALAPIALELETAYREMDMIYNETFLETATKEYLIKHGNQVGLEINPATYSRFKGEFNVDVEIGSRFNLDKFNYTVTHKLSDATEDNPYYTFELECETEGSEPNSFLGDLTPITFVDGLEYAKLTDVIIYGEDEEETEAYRYRLQTHIMNPPIDGNVSQYDEWLGAYEGVGKYKIKPCWNGINTVKLTILNSENKIASDELIREVQNNFDPPTSIINDDTTDKSYPQGRGMGNGQAPIGAIITVDTVSEVPVKVECKVALKNGYDSPIGVKEAVDNYLKSITLDKTAVGYMPISAEIYKAESVDDVISLKITVKNKVMDTSVTPFVDSVALGDNEIAVLDTDNCVWSV